MTDEKTLLSKFYGAFAARDGDAMAACYAPDVRFRDPIFSNLAGQDAGDMWRMLTSRSTDLVVTCDHLEGSNGFGQARWRAEYTFLATGRRVVNLVEARFQFRDGLIAEHRDEFDFWRWSRQALGMSGVLLGWTPIVRSRVRSVARAQLESWQSEARTRSAT
jgi:ketosteroid isomerase-like protein